MYSKCERLARSLSFLVDSLSLKACNAVMFILYPIYTSKRISVFFKGMHETIFRLHSISGAVSYDNFRLMVSLPHSCMSCCHIFIAFMCWCKNSHFLAKWLYKKPCCCFRKSKSCYIVLSSSTHCSKLRRGTVFFQEVKRMFNVLFWEMKMISNNFWWNDGVGCSKQ